MKKRKGTEEFSIAFLDVICCGFGAIILLLIITKTMSPVVLEKTVISLDARVADLQQKLYEIRGETKIFNRDLNAKHEQLSDEVERIAILRGRLELLEQQYAALSNQAAQNDQERGDLAIALQTLTAEMERLLGSQHQRSNDLIGGIPVDSEYLIFIIDTSGSMFSYAWDKMSEELINTLEIYPQLKGIQIMNDMGDYMYSNYRGKWIPDTPRRRAIIIERIKSWNPFSNSSPVEGIQKAIRTFYDPGKKISIFILGDEFADRRRSISEVVKIVNRFNRDSKNNECLVRIHAVGFPVQFARHDSMQVTGIRFAGLMRELTQQNCGTFVGLNEYRKL